MIFLRLFKSFLVTLATLALFSQLSANAQTPAPSEFSVGSYSFTRPDGWTWIQPNSPMRKAHLQIPAPTETEKTIADPVDVVFFYFGPGQGGSSDANIRRWLGQFQGKPEDIDAKTAEAEVAGQKAIFVSAKGTFLSGMPGTPTQPKEDFALRGAILTHPNGDVFVKMTGPRQAVEANETAFTKMVREAKILAK
ncbi:MAG: hypothetical protein ACK5LK_02525 [Chthoniobacterales bacterium]